MTDAFERAAQREDAEHRRRRDQRRSRGRKRGFRIHLTSYIAVQTLLLAVWALSGGGYPWFIFPLLGWGIGLAIHYAASYERPRDRARSDG
jgi:nitroreductase